MHYKNTRSRAAHAHRSARTILRQTAAGYFDGQADVCPHIVTGAHVLMWMSTRSPGIVRCEDCRTVDLAPASVVECEECGRTEDVQLCWIVSGRFRADLGLCQGCRASGGHWLPEHLAARSLLAGGVR